MDIPIEQPENPDIYSFGFDKSLNRGEPIESSVVYDANNSLEPVLLGGSGVIMTDLTLGSGNIKSGNYEASSTGWKLTSEGDLEANSGTFRGSLTGSTINIPNSSDPKFSVSSSGDMVAKSYSLIQQYTAGENITIGSLVCLKHKECSWGNDGEADKETTGIMSAMTYVNQEAPTTNYGSASMLLLGDKFDNGTGFTYYRYILGKIDFTSNPPGLPAWNEVERVYLRLCILSGSTENELNTHYFKACTSSWNENTVTYNTMPTQGNAWVDSVGKVCTAIQAESVAAEATDLSDTGYIEFDITDIYRLWSAGKLTNYGFTIQVSGNSNTQNVSGAWIGGRTRTDLSDYNQAPYLKIIPLVNNPGSGNTITVNDGKAYLAGSDNYNLVKNIVGIAGATVSTNETLDVYTLAEKSVIPSSVFGGTLYKTYYLTGMKSNSTEGLIGELTNDIIRNDYWNIKIGTYTSNGLMIDLDKNPMFIKSLTYPGTGILPPPHARMAVVANGTTSQCILYKDRVQASPLASWATGTSGLLTSTTGYNIYWYK